MTLIVLLILAGVSLSAVFSQNGIFKRAEQATEAYSQAKVREMLELVLSDAQVQKYTEGLTDEQLDNKIGEIEGELLPKEKPENPNLQNIIVDGYIFEIDRSVPKIVDYIGPADGVIITAVVTQNGNWQNPVATLSGTIKTYSGGNITNSTATVVSGNANVTGFPTNGGNYTIGNITEETTIKITATDSTGKTAEKTINVVQKRDTIPPIISDAKAEVDKMKMKISVKAVDNESGLKQINYNVSPSTVTPSATGTLTSGQVLELTASEEIEYTVTFTATDNAGNTSTATAKAETIDGITIAEAKEKINATTYPDYIGTKVIDYNPTAGGVWRVFYYDKDGYFGDGAETLYLKRDYDVTKILDITTLSNYTSYNPKDGGAMLRQQNPLWSTGVGGSSIDLENEHCAAWLCDPNVWNTEYKTVEAKYAIGAPSVEMWTKAYNVYVEKYEPSEPKINCRIQNATGYGWSVNGGSLSVGGSMKIDISIPQSKVIATDNFQWMISPAYYPSTSLCTVSSMIVNNNAYITSSVSIGYCPVVALNH